MVIAIIISILAFGGFIAFTFKRKISILDECSDAADGIMKAIENCKNRKELLDMDVKLDDWYNYYEKKVPADTLNLLLQKLEYTMKYKRLNL